MRVRDNGNSVVLWASARDTDYWADGYNPVTGEHHGAWPCSTLRGKRFVAAFDTNGLYDLTINGRFPGEHDETDGHELSAICADLLATRLDKEHPCYFVTVGQFKANGEA